MVKIKLRGFCLLLFLSILFSFSALAAEPDCLYYFSGEVEGCPDCEPALNYLDQLVEKYPELNLQPFNVYTNLSYFDLLQDYFTVYEVPEPSQGLPVVFKIGR